jgi:hypothetical protein
MERTLKKKASKLPSEMLALERFFPHHIRERAEQILFALSILFLSFSVLFNMLIDTRFGTLWPIFEGLFLVCFALLLKTILIEIYFHSLRVRLEEEHEISLAALLVIGLHHPRRKDLAKAFFYSHLGKEVASKLGIAKETLRHFLHTKDAVDMPLPPKGNLPELAGYIHDEDPYLRDFLDRVHVSKDVLVRSTHETERKHHRHLSSRPLLSHVFKKDDVPVFSLDHVTRDEIDELEKFYKIIITEQATQKIVEFFREDMLRYVSANARIELITELIDSTLSAHRERFHGASVILPADVRSFLIDKKALV